MIDCVLTTWPNHPDRMAYLRRTWGLLQERLTASQHTLRWLCSSETECDPECQWCGEELETFCALHGIQLVWNHGPASLGHGMNGGLRAATTAIHFHHQDDFQLNMPLDLSPGIAFMEANPEVDMIRYCYPPPNFGWRLLEYKDGWKRFDLAANWPYGDEVFLRRKSFPEKFGWYNELNGHASEGEMLWRLVHGSAVILAADQRYYEHFGRVSAVPRTKEVRYGRTCKR